MKYFISLVFVSVCTFAKAQFAIARDTLTVLENNVVLKMPWAGGLNYTNASNIDLNGDGIKDLVMFDRINLFGTGRFRCYIKTGPVGQATYSHSPQLSYSFPPVSNWAVLLDYDCDGKEDLFCSTTSGIKVYRNTSTGVNLQFTLLKSLLYTDYGGQNGKSNLYVSSVGVPGIADIDNDGDLDVLTFSPQGVFIEYHKNLSKELGFKCDSLIFQAVDLCWGRISESQCEVTMNQCLSNKIIVRDSTGSKVYHAGSCLMCFDSDGDLDEDLLMGDISCATVHYVHNTGSSGTAANFTDTTSLYPPSYPIKINNFPCTYYVDTDGDQVKDLVATPNAAGGENYKSVWMYKNVSTTSTVNFQFVKNNFLQDEMIEVGLCAFPVTIDVDADGKKDLLVGNFGYYMSNSLKARLTLYKNVSTNSVPVYSLITRDFGNLSAQNLNNIIPTVGDVDGDGDNDILLGTSTGQIHWLKNAGGAGNPCNFSSFLSNPFNFTTNSAVAAPQLFDLNGDNLLDLLIGGKNGRIAFYKNTGTATSPSFSLITNTLGQVDVKGDVNLFGLDGYAVPYFYKENGNTLLLVGSISGGIWQYAVPTATANFTKLSEAINGLYEGSQSSVLYEDLDGDGKRDLMVGNGAGGLSYFSSSSPYVGIAENDFENNKLSVFPNPVSNILIVRAPIGNEIQVIKIFDLSGRLLISRNVDADFSMLELEQLQTGLYLCDVTLLSSSGIQSQQSKMLIKE